MTAQNAGELEDVGIGVLRPNPFSNVMPALQVAEQGKCGQWSISQKRGTRNAGNGFRTGLPRVTRASPDCNRQDQQQAKHPDE